ncbi:metallopeptidase family protein [Actinomyces urogenitalis]|uniref:metallopeptidase family protein n=1 Tax=Actinomyces urogenitalis TaxID=103621 RepID=UPI000660FE19|nr:metallopeptidase family protein [Actinomyces urogenitalis]MBS5977645.1 metallopeptidase family protein [Actinomyces urogenitalis]MDU0864967.1 metallopeptidase family protein [Actinomyces urogenitalis]MDU0874154.1 metallopeptidase family protein [Actinomyces urogenitalis]MDU1563856.1 metallopeptidase family protein [Actinomyces urogenitalis]MDU1639223.1 metallopeptidase family protein [Actinomyces urogenitalis]
MSPVHLPDADFEDAVGDALDSLPPDLAEAMDNVVILVQDEPEPDMLRREDYDELGRPTLLGLYDGVPLTERDASWSLVLPDRIFIFKGPLERWCTSREELVEEITVTVIHEIAHHFGIDDDRLHELGWE